MIKRETYLRGIRPFIDQDLIKVLTGLRRSGKSVMLQLIREEIAARGVPALRFISLNFEDMSNAHLCTARALHDEVAGRIRGMDGRAYLFFDEIQEVEDWEKCINSLRVAFDCDIYITGSNARLLSGELATYLAGRYVEFVIYPLSFAEFCELYTSVLPGHTGPEMFSAYLTLGGMPYLSRLMYEQEPARVYLQDLYNSVVLKDIVKRNQVRDVDLLERIITYAFTNAGNTFSANAVSKYFKSENRGAAPETVLNYLSYCADAYLLYRVSREDLQGKKLLSVNEKYYLADHGLREAVFGGNMRNINLVLENITFMELTRRGYQVRVGKAGEREIDFVCGKQGNKLYIQVAYLLASPETVEREFGVYAGISDNFPKYVLSLDEFDMSREGIRHMNLREFLLAEEWV